MAEEGARGLWIYNPGQGIWSRIERSWETGQGKGGLISTLARFLTATARV